MFPPLANQQTNPLAGLIAALTGQSGQDPVNLLNPRAAAPVTAPQTAFGFRIPNDTDRKQLVDTILGDTLKDEVKNPWQIATRGLMGLLKTNQDARARDYETGLKSDKAAQLAKAIAGIGSGMDERGSVDLASAIAGISDPDMIGTVLQQADRMGDDRYRRFSDDRNFGAGREDKAQAMARWAEEFAAGRDDQGYSRSKDQRDYLDKLNQRHEERVNAGKEYGAPFRALDADGNPVFVQLNKRGGDPRKLDLFKPDRSIDNEANRAPTPKELAENEEIEAARVQVNRMIDDQGLDAFKDTFRHDDATKDLIAKAKKRKVGADDGFQPFMEYVTGIPFERGKSAAEPKPEPEKKPDQLGGIGALIDALTGRGAEQRAEALPQQQGGPIVRPVPNEELRRDQEAAGQRTPNQQALADMMRLHGASGGSVPPFYPLPRAADGKPDVKAMKPGFFYRAMIKGKEHLVAIDKASGGIEIVE